MTDLAALLHPSVCGELTGLRHDGMVTPWCELLAASLHERGLTVVPETALALDVRCLVRAIQNIASRHGVAKDPLPQSVFSIWGYSTATPDMDAEIAAEYAALRAVDAHRAAEASNHG